MTEQEKVLSAAKAALNDAFGPKEAAKHTVKVTSTPVQGITPETLNTILAEVGAKPIVTSKNGGRLFTETIGPIVKVGDKFQNTGELLNALESEGQLVVTPVSKVIDACNQSTDSFAKKKSIAESKKLIESFKEKLETYPKVLTYEGSVVLCSLIGLKQNNNFRITGLPKADQDLIFSQLPIPETWNGNFDFSVELDDQQDFKLKCEDISDNPNTPPREFNLRFFNSVVRSNASSSDISVERDGEKVTVGKSLVLDQNRIHKLVGSNPSKKDDEEPPRRQSVSGRNAFELRCDLVSMAMDLLFHNNPNLSVSPEKVVITAKTLYSFVENKR